MTIIVENFLLKNGDNMINENDAIKYIPFEKKEFRPGQWDAISQIMDAIEERQKYVILNASVGFGKSLVGYVLAKILEDRGEETYLYTKTKQLQDQYLHDFNDVRLVKGRNNFECAVEPLFDASNGMCQSNVKFKCDLKPILKDGWFYDGTELPTSPLIGEDGSMIYYGDPEFDKNILSGMCPYWKTKINGIMSPITMLNYNYAIADSRFVNQFPYRRLGVFDEGHNIESIVMSEFEYSFSPSAVERETQFKITNHTSIDKWIDDIEILIGIYKELSSKTNSLRVEKKYKDRLLDFKALYELLCDNPQNWIFTQEKQRGHLYNIFKPIKVDMYTHLLFDLTQTCLIMSGTVLKPDVFARDLGIDDYTYIEIPSIIPRQNRPIVKSYVGSMSRTNIDATMPNMIEKIKMLADKHSDEKGLIHTFTYNIANRFKDVF
jgi:Rad3-related DNA helicase